MIVLLWGAGPACEDVNFGVLFNQCYGISTSPIAGEVPRFPDFIQHFSRKNAPRGRHTSLRENGGGRKTGSEAGSRTSGMGLFSK